MQKDISNIILAGLVGFNTAMSFYTLVHVLELQNQIEELKQTSEAEAEECSLAMDPP